MAQYVVAINRHGPLSLPLGSSDCGRRVGSSKLPTIEGWPGELVLDVGMPVRPVGSSGVALCKATVQLSVLIKAMVRGHGTEIKQ